eukprot:1459365-Pyramimonas_sp.AAC.3
MPQADAPRPMPERQGLFVALRHAGQTLTTDRVKEGHTGAAYGGSVEPFGQLQSVEASRKLRSGRGLGLLSKGFGPRGRIRGGRSAVRLFAGKKTHPSGQAEINKSAVRTLFRRGEMKRSLFSSSPFVSFTCACAQATVCFHRAV